MVISLLDQRFIGNCEQTIRVCPLSRELLVTWRELKAPKNLLQVKGSSLAWEQPT